MGSSAGPNTQQTGDNAVILIQLDGAAAGAAKGLTISAGGTTVKGLIITSFQSGAIELNTTGNNLIQGNFIGTDSNNTTGLGSGGTGAILVNNIGSNTIGGATLASRNVISGNTTGGIRITGSSASSNVVQNNYIGTTIQGNKALANQGSGVSIGSGASSNLVGLASDGSGEANIIAGNTANGVSIQTAATKNTISGNYIGIGLEPLTPDVIVPNKQDGVAITTGATNNTVGGATTGNVISGNLGNGVTISGSTTTGNVVKGNYIGTEISGRGSFDGKGFPTGNGKDGVLVDSAPQNQVGGAKPGEANVVSANKNNGIEIKAGSNSVIGNYVGVDKDGEPEFQMGNQANGIVITGDMNTISSNVSSGNDKKGLLITGNNNQDNNNKIGTNAAGDKDVPNGDDGVNCSGNSNSFSQNVVRSNAGTGIAIVSGVDNTIRLNSIFSNGKLGIDLNNDGVTPNDLGDPDTGANYLINFPVLTSATISGTTLTVSGSYNSIPNTLFWIDLYSSSSPDPSGYGEGQFGYSHYWH